MLLLLSVVLIVSVQDGSSLIQGEPCVVSHNRAPGVCKPPSECQSANSDFTNSGIAPTYCTPTPDSIRVCCSDSTTHNAVPNDDRYADYWGSNEGSNMRVSERKCAEYSSHVTETVVYIPLEVNPQPRNLSAPKCDYDGVELIVGGEDAVQGEFPHMAAIGYLSASNDYVFHCGGSLISPRFVLTAGHCSKSTNKMLIDPVPQIVRLGDQNLDPNVHDDANPIDVPIKAIYKYPEYSPPSRYHDIALIELTADVTFNKDIRPACLWTKPTFSGYTKAIATGWGVVDPNLPTPSNVLQKASLTLMQNDFCNRLAGLRQIWDRKWRGFSDGQLCAGELRGGKDTCQGDSGSPLQVVSHDNNCIFHVIGVTSFGRYCARPGKPAVYTRVSSYLDWIESMVWPGEQ